MSDEPTNDINELMARDPMKLTRTDIDLIIRKERDRRHLYNKNPAAAAKKKPAEPKLTEGQKQAKQLNLDIKL